MNSLLRNRNCILAIAIVISMLFSLGIVFAPADEVIQVYDTSSGQDGNAGPIAINLSGQLEKTDLFNHTGVEPSRVYVNQTGLYKISYACTWFSDTATARHIMENWVRLNGTDEITPSRTSCYVRNNGDGRYCSNNGVTVANLSTGAYVELMGEHLQGSTGDTITYNNGCTMGLQRVKNPIAQIFDSAGGDNYESGPITVSLDSATYVNSTTFGHTGDTVNISEDGWYKIYYHVCTENTAQTDRQTVRTYLRENSSFTMNPSYSYSYIRETGTGDRSCTSGYTLQELNNGSYVDIQVEKLAQEAAGASTTLINQSWILVERIEQDSTILYELSTAEQIDEGTTEVLTYDTQLKLGQNVSHTAGEGNISINKPGLYEISYNFGWDDEGADGRIIVCGYMRKNNGDALNGTLACEYSRGDPEGRANHIANNFVINLVQGDSIEMVVNTTGGDVDHYANSSWITIVKLDQDTDLFWNVSTIDLGLTVINNGTITGEALVTSIGVNNDVNVSCISGACGVVSDNITGITMGEDTSTVVEFTCDDATLGEHVAVFNVTSNENGDDELISVSCEVDNNYGSIKIDLINPVEGTIRNIAQNNTVTLQANLSCEGSVDALCGNITTTVLRNDTATFGTGKDGIIRVTTVDRHVNNFSQLVGTASAGGYNLTVSDASNFTAGTEILIIQMQNGTAGTAGVYEFNVIVNKSGNNIYLRRPFQNTYNSGTFNATSATASQIVDVPHFTSVLVEDQGSIGTREWDGYTGGIVVFRVYDNLNTTFGSINASAKGYRGGDCNACGNNDGGDSGESYTGLGTETTNNNGIGGGGGYGPTGFGGEPGAGGGHATAGGDGVGGGGTAIGGEGGLGDADLTRMFFGGGAGGGGDNDGVIPFPQYVNGGGMALIFAKNIVDANIDARGEQGFYAGGAGGTTGSGAGGTIWVATENMNISDINASGGEEIVTGGLGGAGGDGRIRIDHKIVNGHTDPLSGFNASALPRFNDSSIEINTTLGEVPLWTSSINPQSCILNGGEYCILNWTVNATGPINTTHIVNILTVSNFSRAQTNLSGNVIFNITSFFIPNVTLLVPANGSKFFGNGSVPLTFYIEDETSTVNCDLYINGVLNYSGVCNTNENVTINRSFASGFYNWSINVTDQSNLNDSSGNFSFANIINRAVMVTRSITSIGSDMYLTRSIVTNLLDNMTVDTRLIKFDNVNFVGGSYNTLYTDRWNATAHFHGNVSMWNLSVANESSEEINYSIVGRNGYELLKAYMVGLD